MARLNLAKKVSFSTFGIAAAATPFARINKRGSMLGRSSEKIQTFCR